MSTTCQTTSTLGWRHRVTENRTDGLEGSWGGCLVQSHCSKKRACTGLCPVRFSISLWTDNPQPLYATCSSVWPPSQYKKQNNSCFSIISYILICAHYLFSFLGTCSIFFAPSHQVFLHFDKIPLTLLLSRLNSPSSLSLSPYERFPSPLIIFMDLFLYVRVSPVLGNTELDTAHQMWPHQYWVEGNDPFPQPPGDALGTLCFFQKNLRRNQTS